VTFFCDTVYNAYNDRQPLLHTLNKDRNLSKLILLEFSLKCSRRFSRRDNFVIFYISLAVSNSRQRVTDFLFAYATSFVGTWSTRSRRCWSPRAICIGK